MVNAVTSPLRRAMPPCCRALIPVDALYLPRIQRVQLSVRTPGAQRDAGAIFPAGIVSHRGTLLSIYADLDQASVQASVYEYSQ